MAATITRESLPWLAGSVLLLATAGCGSADSSPTSGGHEPTTPASLAYAASTYIDAAPASARSGNLDADELMREPISADLRLADGKGTLVIAAGAGVDERFYDCDVLVPDIASGCEDTGRGVLVWQSQQRDDAGVVYVVVPKTRSAALVMYSGHEITRNPRSSELPIPVNVLLDIANDDRVDVTTSGAAIEGGRELAWWKSGT
jgi:hypothetical protein